MSRERKAYAPNDLLEYADALVRDIRKEERAAIVGHLNNRLNLARQAREAAGKAPTVSGITYYTAGYADALATAIEAIEA